MRDDLAQERHARANGKVRHKGPTTQQNAARDKAQQAAATAGPDALEIIPYGRSREEQERLERKKARGRQGGFGCLLYAFALALFAVYVAGYMSGKAG